MCSRLGRCAEIDAHRPSLPSGAWGGCWRTWFHKEWPEKDEAPPGAARSRSASCTRAGPTPRSCTTEKSRRAVASTDPWPSRRRSSKRHPRPVRAGRLRLPARKGQEPYRRAHDDPGELIPHRDLGCLIARSVDLPVAASTNSGYPPISETLRHETTCPTSEVRGRNRKQQQHVQAVAHDIAWPACCRRTCGPGRNGVVGRRP